MVRRSEDPLFARLPRCFEEMIWSFLHDVGRVYADALRSPFSENSLRVPKVLLHLRPGRDPTWLISVVLCR